MADIPDNIKGWSYIKKLQDYYSSIIDANNNLQSLKSTWQAEGVDIEVEGFPLTSQEVNLAANAINSTNTYISDIQTFLDGLMAKNIGSHKGNALD